MVHVLQHAAVSKPARSTVTEAASKDAHVALAGYNALKVDVYGYAELVAVAGEYRLQVRLFASHPRDEVLDLLGLAVLGRSHEHQLWPLSFDQAAIEALELIGDLLLPPAELHRGAGVSAIRPETNLALLPLDEGKEEVVRNTHTLKVGVTDLRKYARITQ